MVFPPLLLIGLLVCKNIPSNDPCEVRGQEEELEKMLARSYLAKDVKAICLAVWGNQPNSRVF